MGNLLNFGGSSSRIRVHVKDLRTGKIYSIPVNQPSTYTLDNLLNQITSRISNIQRQQMILKYKKKDIIDENHPEKTLTQALDLESNNDATNVSLYLERVERRGGVAKDWTVYVKTLTGRTYDIEFSNPQEVSVLGLKLLIEEESGIKPEQMRLVIDNDQLEDNNKTIQEYPGVTNECTIHLVMKNN